MKKDFLVFAAILTVLTLALSGCGKEFSAEENVDENVSEIAGSSEFFSSISYINDVATKAGEVSEEEMKETIQPLFVSAKEYLTLNGYNYLEDFEEDDPRIIMTAYTLLGIDFAGQMTVSTKSAADDYIDDYFDIVDCVLRGIGVKELLDGAVFKLSASQAAKFCANKVLKNVSYVGTIIMVFTTGACIYKDIKGRIIESRPVEIIDENPTPTN